MDVLNITPANLTGTQITNYHKLENNPQISNMHFIRINPLAQTQDSGMVWINLPFLASQHLQFASREVNYQSSHNYGWYGVVNTDSFAGSLTLQYNYGALEGNMTIGDVNYGIFDLTAGVWVVGVYTLQIMECGTDDSTLLMGSNNTQNINSLGIQPLIECVANYVNVLVLYTPAADAATTNIQTEAALAVQQVKDIFSNSGNLAYDANKIQLAGVEELPGFVEDTVNQHPMSNDLDKLSGLTYVHNLRNAYNADIVMLLADHVYYSTLGIAYFYGQGASNAYGISTVPSAVNGTRSFAHEFGHIFGGDHQPDAEHASTSEPYARAYHFFTRNWFLGPKKHHYTIVYTRINKPRIDYYSNPDIEYDNKPTGTSVNDNAQVIYDNFDNVAAYKEDPVSFFSSFS